MSLIRKCCGIYCALIMFIGIFFFIVTIILEVTNNQFLLNKLQEFTVSDPAHTRWNTVNPNYPNITSVQKQYEDGTSNQVIAMAIAIGVNL